jgi:hypothetical protein
MSGWIAVTIFGHPSERHQEKLFSFFEQRLKIGNSLNIFSHMLKSLT